MSVPFPSRPTPRPGVLDIDLYVPGKSAAAPGVRTFKLSSNETPLGPSPHAREAYAAAARTLDLYPDGSARRLREAIGRRYGLDPDRIVCGCGSDDLLSLLAYAFVGPGDEGIVTRHGFLVHKIAIQAAGGTAVVADETDLTADVDRILARLSPRTRAVFLANPNNPTGTYLPDAGIRRLHAALPAHVLLVLDAAYAEYAGAADYASGLDLAAKAENVVVTRTFSKVHGLAALRIGWCFAPPVVVDALNRIRGPFNTNGPAIAAGVAAIEDVGHVEASVAHNARWLPWLTDEIRRLGVEVVPSAANFVLLRFPETPGRTAEEADAFLTRHGLVLRAVKAYGLPDCLRLSVGDEEANRLVVATLARFMGEAARA